MQNQKKNMARSMAARLVASFMIISFLVSMLPATALADQENYGGLQSAAKDAVRAAETSQLQADVDRARELIVGLHDGHKKTSLQSRLNAVQESINTREANAVIAAIDALPTIDTLALADNPAVQQARAGYNALTDDQKALVTNLAILEAAEARIDKLEADVAAALTVDNRIAALPAVADLVLGDKDAVAAARDAYMALTADQKALVTKLDGLAAAEAKITELKAAADKAAAWDVDNRIAELPAVEDLILYSRPAVESCRDRYTALTADQKALVTNLAILEAAEVRIAKLEADVAAAAAVENLIAALPNPYRYSYPPMTLSDKDDVYAAYAAYTALTADQKALVAVANLEKLQAAKTRIDQMEADLPAALAVDAMIAALPDVHELTLADKDAVYAAYAAFEALTPDQRQLVPGAGKLVLLHGMMYHMEAEAIPALAVYDMIAALPPLDEITYFNGPAVEAVNAASEAYDRLSTSFQKSLVTNYAVLEAAQARVDEIFAGLFAAADVEYIIGNLPNAYELSLEAKADVEAARAAYEALPDSAKPFVRNLAHLEEAAAEIARQEALIQLQPAKDEAISAINALCSSLSEADYHPYWWTRIGQLRTIGCNAIQQVGTIEDINAIRDDFLAMINGIPRVAQDDPEAVAAAKEAAHTALGASFSACDSSNYSPENWAVLTTAKTDGDAAIEAAGTTAAVYAARDAALLAMADVTTITAE